MSGLFTSKQSMVESLQIICKNIAFIKRVMRLERFVRSCQNNAGTWANQGIYRITSQIN